MNYLELVIGLHQRGTVSYEVQVRIHDPIQGVEQPTVSFYPVRFDLDRLSKLAIDANDNDSTAYGRLLSDNLFKLKGVRSRFNEARTAAQTAERPLRLRLCIEERWSPLHSLRWETLRDPNPKTNQSLLKDQKIFFVRSLGSFDMRPVRLRSKTGLRALVAIASPSDIQSWKPLGRPLASIDVKTELDRTKKSLLGITVTELGVAQRVTLDAIIRLLRDNDFDVLYLVCHGALLDKEPMLWLEDENGEAKRIEGTKLVEGLNGLSRLPRLVVLASCQSAGTDAGARSDDEGALASLGPRIAEAGVPAVIAMQGNVRQETVAKFVPKFFSELSKDGQIDRAMTEARFEVRGQSDFWAPVLFSRLTSGRLWYEHRSGLRTFEAWPGLIEQIIAGKCVPILGSGLLEPFVGSPRDIARQWASTYQYPMVPSPLCDLPEVAQYLSITQGRFLLGKEFLRGMAEEVRRRWPDLEETRSLAGKKLQGKDLLRLLSAVRDSVRQKNADEPHQVLARLSCPLYLTTNPDNLLVDALESEGKQPRKVLCHWHGDSGALAAPSPPEPFTPTVQEPLVYQLFGDLDDVESMVLTEDDYFRYLIGIVRMQAWPQASVFVEEKLVRSGLIFLGFRIVDWDFRVFVHFLNSQEGRGLRENYKHVAVQLDPEDGLGSDPGQARRYLEKYFSSSSDSKMPIEIYWGSVEDFLQELSKRWERSA